MALLATPARAHDRDRDFDLPQAGVYIEGIGVDEHAGVFYVSATNQSGTIYRGNLSSRDRRLAVWQPPTPGNDGRGIEVDRAGRVFVAGGPAAEVRVFDRRGALLAELATGAAGSYLNDLWIGPGRRRLRDRLVAAGDLARVQPLRPLAHRPLPRRLGDDRLHAAADRLRPRRDHDQPQRALPADHAGHDRPAVADRPVDAPISEVDLGGTSVINADGIVLRGHTLYVVQNFSRQISKLQLGRHFERGALGR